MSNGNRNSNGNRPQQAAPQPAATSQSVPSIEGGVPLQDTLDALNSRIQSAETERDALKATLGEQIQAMANLRGDHDRLLAASQNRTLSDAAVLQRQMEGMKAGYATTKKLLTWLIKTYSMNKLHVMLYDLADDRTEDGEFQCTPEEMHKIIDFLKLKMDARDGSIVESYRKQVVELAETKTTRQTVKAETLAATVDVTDQTQPETVAV